MGDFDGHPFRGNQWTDTAGGQGAEASGSSRGDWGGGIEANTVEGGKEFKTGQPVEFTYLHNTTKAPKRIHGREDTFQQGVEPAGFYVNHGASASQIEHARSIGLEVGTLRFEKPLVVKENTRPGGRIYDEHSWKQNVSRQFGGKTGRALSQAILRAGYDGIVTVNQYGTGEIVALRRSR
jgi:hypothetical protein